MIGDLVRLADPQRLATVATYDLEHPELKRRLDEVASRTATRLRFPIGLVTVLLDSAALFAGSHGLVGWLAESGGAPAEWSFCTSTVLGEAPHVIPDARLDAVHSDNPLVTVDGALSYAGVPLRTPEGLVLGSHCVVGVEPHSFTAAEIGVLQAAAAEIVGILEEYRRPV